MSISSCIWNKLSPENRILWSRERKLFKSRLRNKRPEERRALSQSKLKNTFDKITEDLKEAGQHFLRSESGEAILRQNPSYSSSPDMIKSPTNNKEKKPNMEHGILHPNAFVCYDQSYISAQKSDVILYRSRGGLNNQGFVDYQNPKVKLKDT